MMKLPDITLITLTGQNYKIKEHLEALKKSQEKIDFGDVKLVQLKEITDIDSWNKAVIYELPKWVYTNYALFIHWDGYVINPEMWTNRWLRFDWCSSPWPLPSDSTSYRDEEGNIVRVGNSVGLRSKKLMDLIATRPIDEFWKIKEKYGNSNEDGFITCHNRKWLESKGCKFMPFSQAVYFGKEVPLPEHKGKKQFLFHKWP